MKRQVTLVVQACSICQEQETFGIMHIEKLKHLLKHYKQLLFFTPVHVDHAHSRTDPSYACPVVELELQHGINLFCSI